MPTLDDLKKNYYRILLGYTEAEAVKKSIRDLETEFFTNPAGRIDIFQMRTGSGLYYSFPIGSHNTAVESSGTMRLFPAPIPRRITIDRVGVEVTSAGSAGSVIRMGIYKDDGEGRPSGAAGALVRDFGTIDSTVTGLRELDLTGNTLVLEPGLYWFAVVSQGAPATNPTIRVSSMAPYGIGNTNNPAYTPAGYQMGAVTGALPDAPVLSGSASGASPRMFIRVA